MESKQIVFTGLVITAMLTVIVLNGWAADMVIAFIILLTGIILTYFIALNQKRVEQSSYLMDLIKACNKIGEQDNLDKAMEQLCEWTRGLLEIEKVMISIPQAGGFKIGDTNLYPLFNALYHQNEPMLKAQEFNKDDNINGEWPEGISWILVFPLVRQNEHMAFLLLADAKARELNARDWKTLEVLGEQSMARLSAWQTGREIYNDHSILINSLIAGIEAADPLFRGHSQRVKTVSLLIAEKLGLAEKELTALGYAALLHDIGKGAERVINQNDEAGTTSAWDHANLGAALIPDVGIFKQVKEAVRYHHERYDGSGFPEGLCRTEIPFMARIIAVADVYDALTYLSPEEQKLNHKEAVHVIKKGTGTLFDPLVVVALEETEQEIDNKIKQK